MNVSFVFRQNLNALECYIAPSYSVSVQFNTSVSANSNVSSRFVLI
jgi:hypothetical protein